MPPVSTKSIQLFSINTKIAVLTLFVQGREPGPSISRVPILLNFGYNTIIEKTEVFVLRPS